MQRRNRPERKSPHKEHQAFIEEVLGVYADCGMLHKHGKHRTEVTIKIEGKNLTFELLQKLSDALQTKLIDISPYYSEGGCDTCSYGEETWIELTITNPCFPDHIAQPVPLDPA